VPYQAERFNTVTPVTLTTLHLINVDFY